MGELTFYICFGSVFYAFYAPYYGSLSESLMRTAGEFHFMTMCVLLWPMVVIFSIKMEIEIYLEIRDFKRGLDEKCLIK